MFLLQSDVRKVKDAGKEMLVEFERNKTFLDMIFMNLKRMIAFAFVGIILG
jgi:hypothetical protein